MKYLMGLLLLFTNIVYGSECSHLYYQPKSFSAHTIELCNRFYVSIYDTQLNAAVFTSELVAPTHKRIARQGNFKIDKRLWHRKAPGLYNNEDYDIGHLVPAADASNKEEMLETFLTSNATPQNKKLNRGAWRILELRVRNKINNQNQSVYVETEAIYDDRPLRLNGIPIPKGYIKRVYLNILECYYADNVSNAKVIKIGCH